MNISYLSNQFLPSYHTLSYPILYYYPEEDLAPDSPMSASPHASIYEKHVHTDSSVIIKLIVCSG
jgi:hypothetical protein